MTDHDLSWRARFPPIAEYAFLADGHVNALIAPSGSVEWLCLPRPDGPSVFGSILDRSAGGFRLGPKGTSVPLARRYLPGTLVLESTWHTATGWLTVVDALCVGDWHECEALGFPQPRQPSGHGPAHLLLRLATCTHGRVDLEMSCEPVLDYGRKDAEWNLVSSDRHRAITNPHGPEADSMEMTISTNLELAVDGRRLAARRKLAAGDCAFAALSWCEGEPCETTERAKDHIDSTVKYWQEWLAPAELPDHPWRVHLEQSALVLKGLTYAPTGALLAAATTSLPETPGGKRNWDYRFSWVRDSSFTLWALHTLGYTDEADDYFSFLADACADHDLQVLYRLDGSRDAPETNLDHLSGYEEARPVRIGNRAVSQRQHDMWGVLVDSVYTHVKGGADLNERTWHLVEDQVEKAIEFWREPDCGIWEVRGEARHFTSSKLMCWVAVERGARLAGLRGDRERETRWSRVANEIHEDIQHHGVNEHGVFTQSYGSSALDASLLLLPLTRFLPREDPNLRSTVIAIADQLSVDGLIVRYRNDPELEGVGGEEATFTICSFWLVSALAEIGEEDRARRLCEKLLALRGPLGLYAEEIDATTGRHWGNFPQAFTHLALINAVAHVIRMDRDEPQRFAPLAATGPPERDPADHSPGRSTSDAGYQP